MAFPISVLSGVVSKSDYATLVSRIRTLRHLKLSTRQANSRRDLRTSEHRVVLVITAAIAPFPDMRRWWYRPTCLLMLTPGVEALPWLVFRSRFHGFVLILLQSPTSSRPPNSTYFPHQNRIMAGTPPTYYPHPYSGYRHPSLLGPRFPGASLIDLAGPSSSSSSAAAMNRPLPPPPQIPEEDECPVCHRELPSRELPNFEARRESHISSCIMAHSTYSPGPDASGRPGNHGPVQPRPARRTGMFPYLATEKDCVDSAECTICLEEFEVGVPMARLECLCRFHRSCITAWFVDHPGRCPVHQHDSFGY